MIHSSANDFTAYDPAKADTYTEANENALNTSMTKDKAPLPQELVKARNAQTLADWQNLQTTIPGAYLVHSLSDIHLNDTALFDAPAQSIFSQWDLISTSLVNLCDIKAFTKAPASVTSTERKNGCYGEIGLILDVPPQNIYGTHRADVLVDNHIGVGRSTDIKQKRQENTQKLAIHLKESINILGSKVTGGFSNFVTPAQLLNETKGYNEVLVIGRDSVNIHPGEKKTGTVKVKGILSARTTKFTNPADEKNAQHSHMKAIQKLQAVNPGLEVHIF